MSLNSKARFNSALTSAISAKLLIYNLKGNGLFFTGQFYRGKQIRTFIALKS
jgi:hypothetical protein